MECYVYLAIDYLTYLKVMLVRCNCPYAACVIYLLILLIYVFMVMKKKDRIAVIFMFRRCVL